MADKKPKKTPTQKLAENKGLKNTDFVAMSDQDLEKAINSLKKDLIVLKKGTITKEVVNVHAYNLKRKELARALTAQNNKTREEQ